MPKYRKGLILANDETNYMIEWMVLAKDEKQTIECKTLDRAIHLRQQLYGLRTRIMNAKELRRIEQIGNIQLRITKMDGSTISMNSLDFKSRKDKGEFDPCLLIGEQYGASYQSEFKAALRDHIKAGTLPSQIAEQEGKDMERELIEKMERDGTTSDSNPGFMRGMEMLRRGPPKPDEEEK